jgi:hypothetical protein
MASASNSNKGHGQILPTMKKTLHNQADVSNGTAENRCVGLEQDRRKKEEARAGDAAAKAAAVTEALAQVDAEARPGAGQTQAQPGVEQEVVEKQATGQRPAALPDTQPNVEQAVEGAEARPSAEAGSSSAAAAVRPNAEQVQGGAASGVVPGTATEALPAAEGAAADAAADAATTQQPSAEQDSVAGSAAEAAEGEPLPVEAFVGGAADLSPRAAAALAVARAYNAAASEQQPTGGAS